MDNLYTIKQLAGMLKTNPETVRRWIRAKKLKTDIKESGSLPAYISKKSIEDFAKIMPKYAAILAGLGFMVPGIGPIAGAIGSMALARKQLENEILNAKLSKEEIKHYIESEILTHETNIKMKENDIRKIELEIDKEKEAIKELKYIIKKKEI